MRLQEKLGPEYIPETLIGVLLTTWGFPVS